MAGSELQGLIGRYEGEGAWFEDAGDSKRYRIEMSLEPAGQDRTRIWFRHAFFEEGSTTEQAVIVQAVGAGVLAVSLEGAPIGGRGYGTQSLVHYELDVPGNRVEVSVVADGKGGATVLGSSQKNASGRFIWWRESLVRAGS